jgi:hypothetical protein
LVIGIIKIIKIDKALEVAADWCENNEINSSIQKCGIFNVLKRANDSGNVRNIFRILEVISFKYLDLNQS